MHKAIQVRYLGPNRRSGSRLRASIGGSLTKVHSVTIPYPHELPRDYKHWQAAEALIRKLGWAHLDGYWFAGGMPDESTVFVYSGLDKLGRDYDPSIAFKLSKGDTTDEK